MNQPEFTRWAKANDVALDEFGVLVTVLANGDAAILESVFENTEAGDRKLVCAYASHDARLIHSILGLTVTTGEFIESLEGEPKEQEDAIGRVLRHYAILAEMFGLGFKFDVSLPLTQKPATGLLLSTAKLASELQLAIFTDKSIDQDKMMQALEEFGTYLGAAAAGMPLFPGWERLLDITAKSPCPNK